MSAFLEQNLDCEDVRYFENYFYSRPTVVQKMTICDLRGF